MDYKKFYFYNSTSYEATCFQILLKNTTIPARNNIPITKEPINGRISNVPVDIVVLAIDAVIDAEGAGMGEGSAMLGTTVGKGVDVVAGSGVTVAGVGVAVIKALPFVGVGVTGTTMYPPFPDDVYCNATFIEVPGWNVIVTPVSFPFIRNPSVSPLLALTCALKALLADVIPIIKSSGLLFGFVSSTMNKAAVTPEGMSLIEPLIIELPLLIESAYEQGA